MTPRDATLFRSVAMGDLKSLTAHSPSALREAADEGQMQTLLHVSLQSLFQTLNSPGAPCTHGVRDGLARARECLRRHGRLVGRPLVDGFELCELQVS